MPDYNAINRRIGITCPVGNRCTDCIARTKSGDCVLGDDGETDINGILAMLETWDAAHPAPKPKTYAEDFREKFPKSDDPVRYRCVGTLYGNDCRSLDCKDNPYPNCQVCWNRPMPEKEEPK